MFEEAIGEQGYATVERIRVTAVLLRRSATEGAEPHAAQGDWLGDALVAAVFTAHPIEVQRKSTLDLQCEAITAKYADARSRATQSRSIGVGCDACRIGHGGEHAACCRDALWRGDGSGIARARPIPWCSVRCTSPSMASPRACATAGSTKFGSEA